MPVDLLSRHSTIECHYQLERSNAMSSTADRAEIEALFQQFVRAHADRDADAIVDAYAPDAVIYDKVAPRRQ
jgi:ketosteroid isomerase-like protein